MTCGPLPEHAKSAPCRAASPPAGKALQLIGCHSDTGSLSWAVLLLAGGTWTVPSPGRQGQGELRPHCQGRGCKHRGACKLRHEHGGELMEEFLKGDLGSGARPTVLAL